MDLEQFQTQVRAMNARMVGLRGDDRGAPEGIGDRLEKATQALDTTMEELLIAEEELRQQSEESELNLLRVEEERQRYQELFESAPLGYLVTDRDGIIREVNRAGESLLSAPREYLVGKPLASQVALEQRPAFRAELIWAARTDRDDWQVRLQPSRGPAVDVSLTVSAVRVAGGEVTWLLWMVRDLNRPSGRERVEAGADLATEEEARSGAEAPRTHYFDLVQGIDAIVWEADSSTGRYTFVSRRAEEWLGYPVARWLDDPDFWTGIVHPDDRDWIKAMRQKSLVGLVDQEMEYRLTASDGRSIWVREGVRVVPHEGPGPARLRGILWNISRRKKIERQLYTAKRELAEQLEDLSYLHELAGRLSTTPVLRPLLEEVLGSVLGVLGGEMGAVRLFDPASGQLVIVTSQGLPAEYLAAYHRITPPALPCGIAFSRRERVVIEDLETDPALAPFLEVARASRIRAAYSTPVITRGGEPLGTIVAYFHDAHRPSSRQSRFVDLFAHEAAEFIEHARRHEELRRKHHTRWEWLGALNDDFRGPLEEILREARTLGSHAAGDDRISSAARNVESQARALSLRLDDLREQSNDDPAPAETGS